MRWSALESADDSMPAKAASTGIDSPQLIRATPQSNLRT